MLCGAGSQVLSSATSAKAVASSTAPMDSRECDQILRSVLVRVMHVVDNALTRHWAMETVWSAW